MERTKGAQRITIADVAESLGVSKTTVSRAISGKGRISDETRQRVLAYIKQNDYKPNVIAKSLAQSKTYNIAMLLPTDCNMSELPFFQNCMYGVCEEAAAREYDVLAVYHDDGSPETLKRLIDNHKIDGILLSRTLVEDGTARLVRERGIPIVAIGSSADEELVQVDNDHLSACRALTERLLSQGMRKLALIGGSRRHVVTRTRYQGFAEAFRAADVPIAADLVYLDVEQAPAVDHIVDELVKAGAECILCMDDMLCSRVLERLEQSRVSVPQQIRVASFYGSLLVENHVPGVTTLKFDEKKLGMTACGTLIDLIEGRRVEARRLLAYTISIKESTK